MKNKFKDMDSYDDVKDTKRQNESRRPNKVREVITYDDFVESKRQGETKRAYKQAEKDKRKTPKQTKSNLTKRRILEDEKIKRMVEEDDIY